MNLQELDELIRKYYEGSATEKEESFLFELLSSGELPGEYKEDLALITGLSSPMDIPEPDSGFESRIMATLDRSEEKDRLISIKRRVYYAVSVAATLLIIISSYLLTRVNAEPEDTFTDPVLAYNATLEVLGRIGQTINTGSDAITDLSVISQAEDNLSRLSVPARMVARELEPLKFIDKSIEILDIRPRK